jgi:hypothetical protein
MTTVTYIINQKCQLIMRDYRYLEKAWTGASLGNVGDISKKPESVCLKEKKRRTLTAGHNAFR